MEDLKQDIENYKRQLEVGKKEYDYFEILNSRKDIFKFKNLKEWDEDEYIYQKSVKTMVREKYDSLYIPPTFFRAIKDNKIYYGILKSAREYLLEETITMLMNKVDKKYPLEERSIDDILSNLGNNEEPKAFGKEKEREELRKNIMKNYLNIEEEIVENIDSLSDKTFKIVGGEFMEGINTYIVGGFKAAESINFKTFFKDFENKEESFNLLTEKLESFQK